MSENRPELETQIIRFRNRTISPAAFLQRAHCLGRADTLHADLGFLSDEPKVSGHSLQGKVTVSSPGEGLTTRNGKHLCLC